jgi:acetyltransferase-like isoleucine patch superfamily enzyme
VKNDLFEVFAERHSPSDEELICIAVLVKNGDLVQKGKVVFEIEGAKAIFEVASEEDGFFYSIIEEGDKFKVGQKIGYISKSEVGDFAETLADFVEETKQIPNLGENGDLNFSVPAVEYLRASINKDHIIKKLSGTVGLVTTAMIKDIESAIRESSPTLSLVEKEFWSDYINRSNSKEAYIFIGGGFGAIQTLDLLNSRGSFLPIGYISDLKENLIDQFGLPLLGDTSLESLKSITEKNKGVKFILTVGSSPALRCRIAQIFGKLNIVLETLIHPTATIGANVDIGPGTLIFAHVYIGTGSVIGDASFISSNSSIEHHNKIGEGFCAGPNLNTSGGVTIGREVRFGMNIGIEPGVVVGHNCVVASGSVLTRDLADGSVLKSRSS